MKKVLALLFLLSFVVVPATALGAPVCGDGDCESPETASSCAADCGPNVAPTVVRNVEGLIGLINKIGNWVFVVLMAVAGTFLIVAGLMWVTAGGNPEKVTKARQMLVNALIGVAIGLLARGIVMVIRSVIS